MMWYAKPHGNRITKRHFDTPQLRKWYMEKAKGRATEVREE
jgi:hypothetical protein